MTVSTRDGNWRVYTHVGEFDVVQVAQPMSVRSREAASVALRTVLPMLLLLPLLGALVWWVVGRGLHPLRRVALEVSRRSSDALQPIGQDGLPEEVQPLIGSLNGLLQRLSHALEVQRGFVADAAHALRTPVTALSLQAQLLERAESADERQAAASRLKEGLKRVRRSGGGLPLVGGLRTLEQLGLQRQRRHRRAQRGCAASASETALYFERVRQPLQQPVERTDQGLRLFLGSPSWPIGCSASDERRETFQRDPSQRAQAATPPPAIPALRAVAAAAAWAARCAAPRWRPPGCARSSAARPAPRRTPRRLQ